MSDDLMTKEIKIHPLVAGTSFGTAEQFAVKGARFGKIAHGKGQMKTRTGGHGMRLNACR